jgi:hypothetical protein
MLEFGICGGEVDGAEVTLVAFGVVSVSVGEASGVLESVPVGVASAVGEGGRVGELVAGAVTACVTVAVLITVPVATGASGVAPVGDGVLLLAEAD